MNFIPAAVQQLGAQGGPPGGAPPGGPPLVGPPQLGNPQGTILHRTYTALYADAAMDQFGGNYANFYNEYSVGVGGPTPTALRDSLYSSGNAGTPIHALVHVRDPNAAPEDPGYIMAYHRMTRHVARFGQFGQPFDGHGHAFMGDVANGQVPVSVQIPDTLFNQLTVVQVPTAARLDQLLLADPDMKLVGPYDAGDPDVQPVVTRGLVIVPNEYVLPFLSMGMQPVEAYRVLRGLLVQKGHEVACEPLLDWLRVAMTRRAPDALPRTVTAPLTIPMYTPPAAHHAFVSYRLEIAHRDLPQLSTIVQQQGAQVIANGLSTLVQEQRLARQEAAEQRRIREARKTPQELYGVLLERLMRWAQVTDETHLAPIHKELANTKKSKVRGALQKAMEDCLFANDFVEDFPVSTALASKIVELSWYGALPDDFSCGLNLFAVGALDDDAVEHQRQQNRHADLLTANEGTAALDDIAEVTTPKADLVIPRTFTQLRYQIQRMYALWSVLLGAEHPMSTGYRAFLDQLVRREKFLESVEPANPAHRHLVPALVGRWLQLRTNLWRQAQAKSVRPIEPSNFTSLFDHMALMDHWEPRFPSRYLETAPPAKAQVLFIPSVTAGGKMQGADNTAGNLAGGTSPSATSGGGLEPPLPGLPRKSTTIRNDTYNPAFQKFKAMGIRTSALRDHLKEHKVAHPKNSSGQEICLAWHVVGMCNTNCKRSATHSPQTPADDEALLTWCNTHYTLSA